MIEIYGHETEDKLHKQIYGHRSNIIDNVNNIVYQHYINLIIRSFQWEYTSTKQYFILSTFYCQANTDNGSHTSYQLTTFSALHINHSEDNILQKHNIISFIIISEKWHNTARDIVIDAESLSSGIRSGYTLDRSFSVYYVSVNSCDKCTVDIICKIWISMQCIVNGYI